MYLFVIVKYDVHLYLLIGLLFMRNYIWIQTIFTFCQTHIWLCRMISKILMTLTKQIPSKKMMIRILTVMCELAKDSSFSMHAIFALPCLIAKKEHIYSCHYVNTLFSDQRTHIFCCQYIKVNDSFFQTLKSMFAICFKHS